MTDGKLTEAGSSTFFTNTGKGTIFEGISVTEEKSFEKFIKDIALGAASAQVQLYDDLSKNSATNKYLTGDQVKQIEKLADHLAEATAFHAVKVKHSAKDVKNLLKDTRPKALMSPRDMKREAENLLKSPFAKRSTGSKTNQGKNGKVLGSAEYGAAVGSQVFVNYSKLSLSLRSAGYKAIMKAQAEAMLQSMKSAVTAAKAKSEYMEYSTRKTMAASVKKLASYTSGSPLSAFEKELLKLRRLEDFHNRVIQVNSTGGFSLVDARLIWNGGKNTLYLSTKIFYLVNPAENLIDPQKAARQERQKEAAEREFRTWADGSPYTVFGGQLVHVKMNIERTDSDSFDSIKIFLDSPTATSMSWGGEAIIGWDPQKAKIMFMEESQYSDAKGYDGIARHEFGHALGLGDAYNVTKEHGIPVMYEGPGVDPNLPGARQYAVNTQKAKLELIDLDMVMNNNSVVKGKDIEMVIWAFATGERQNFAVQSPFDKVSELLNYQ